jgi:hypothetical protein
MTMDAIGRKARFLKSELRNTQVYERFRKLSAENWDVTLVDDTVPQKPAGAIVLTREEARNHQTYMAAKAKAEQEGKFLWVEE